MEKIPLSTEETLVRFSGFNAQQPFASYCLHSAKKVLKSHNYIVSFVLTLKCRMKRVKLLVTITKQLVIGGGNYSRASY